MTTSCVQDGCGKRDDGIHLEVFHLGLGGTVEEREDLVHEAVLVEEVGAGEDVIRSHDGQHPAVLARLVPSDHKRPAENTSRGPSLFRDSRRSSEFCIFSCIQ